jgi:hypothetical protein
VLYLALKNDEKKLIDHRTAGSVASQEIPRRQANASEPCVGTGDAQTGDCQDKRSVKLLVRQSDGDNIDQQGENKKRQSDGDNIDQQGENKKRQDNGTETDTGAAEPCVGTGDAQTGDCQDKRSVNLLVRQSDGDNIDQQGENKKRQDNGTETDTGAAEPCVGTGDAQTGDCQDKRSVKLFARQSDGDNIDQQGENKKRQDNGTETDTGAAEPCVGTGDAQTGDCQDKRSVNLFARQSDGDNIDQQGENKRR